VQYVGKQGGHWLAIPATPGSQFKGPCSRIDYMKQFAGIDVQAMYPAGAEPKADNWTMETFLKAAEACHKGGHPFGIGLGITSDSVDSAGAFFRSFGAMLVNEKGDITVKSDQVRQALEYMINLGQFLPPDVVAWDDASNNKFLVSGQASMIMNPPSAWAVAKRDAPKVAEQCWTHGMPKGPAGRYGPYLPYFWGTWNFSKNIPAAKSLLRHLSQADSVEKLVAASGGYDLPSFANLTKFKVWAEETPPAGTLFHYPDPYNQQIKSIAAAPAPPKIAVQIYNQGTMTKMVARAMRGEKVESVINWAESELEGFMRG
jgi:ABC-type glycerol-3-phosphate transport system substrate-binding protein